MEQSSSSTTETADARFKPSPTRPVGEVRRQDHKPFGDQHYAWGAHVESKGWIGEREEETELVYLNARYYDQEIGTNQVRGFQEVRKMAKFRVSNKPFGGSTRIRVG